MKSKHSEVLNLLKTGAALSAKEIEFHLNWPSHPEQKPVRNAIDHWRAHGEHIWHDESLGVFWWSADGPLGQGARRWKRPYRR